MKIENTSPERIEALAAGQREYFRSGATLGEDDYVVAVGGSFARSARL